MKIENSEASNVAERSEELRTVTKSNGTDSTDGDYVCKKDLKEIYRILQDLQKTKVRIK